MDIYRENVKVPEVEPAPDSILNSYPQALQSYPQNSKLSTGLTSYPQGMGSSSHARKRDPRVLSVASVCIILPNKKYTLK
jgi:hypothetical protein